MKIEIEIDTLTDLNNELRKLRDSGTVLEQDGVDKSKIAALKTDIQDLERVQKKLEVKNRELLNTVIVLKRQVKDLQNSKKIVEIIVPVVPSGADLRVLRKKTDLSATDVAKEVDITPSALSAIETGHAVPGYRLLIRLLNHYRKLGVTRIKTSHVS